MQRREILLAEVLAQITPKESERNRMICLAEKLKLKVERASNHAGLKAIVRVEGSFAKDTWLSRELDIDVFMRVPKSIPRESLGDTCLKVAREATKGSAQLERFAEHPYLEAMVDDVRVNIVPCYDTKPGQWISATDRTPFHTDYIEKHLTEPEHQEVRLLKKFMKGIGVYGAEIKIGGFSGYLCELLILRYKSFQSTLEAFATGRQKIIIDLENHYKNRENEINLLFDEPLIFVDPVDRARNVASAVQKTKLYSLIAAAQAFLHNPTTVFFFPQKTIALEQKEMTDKLKSQGLALIFVVFKKSQTVPDVLWGQLYRSQRSLQKLLKLNYFNVLRDTAWSDEKYMCMFIFEVEAKHVSQTMRHIGPPLDKEEEARKFVSKYLDNQGVVSGPYIEGDRWFVLLKRKFSRAEDLLEAKLRSGGKDSGVANGITNDLKKGFKILVNEDIVKIYGQNKEFAVFLTDFLDAKPKWLGSQPA